MSPLAGTLLTIVLAWSLLRLIFLRLKFPDLKISGCFMMSLCKLWKMLGTPQIISLTRQKGWSPN
jgi:hypothetical protein